MCTYLFVIYIYIYCISHSVNCPCRMAFSLVELVVPLRGKGRLSWHAMIAMMTSLETLIAPFILCFNPPTTPLMDLYQLIGFSNQCEPPDQCAKKGQ